MQNNTEWIIEENGIIKSDLTWREALFTLSTGSLGIRAVLEEHPEGYMGGTYLGGVFNTGESWCNDMVNLPDFTGLYVTIEDETLSVDTSEVLSHRRYLDMKQNLLVRETDFKTRSGKEISWKSERFVSMESTVLCVEKHTFTAKNFSGKIKITSKIDGNTLTHDCFGIEKVSHYNAKKAECDGNVIAMQNVLTDSRHPVVTASRLICGGKCEYETGKREISAITTLELECGRETVIKKYSACMGIIQSSPSKIWKETVALINKSADKGYENLFEAHRKIMDKLWQDADFEISGDDQMQRKIRYNIYVMICAGPRGNEFASIGARGLTGERYRGHIYWDTEAFMLAFYIMTDPKTAKDILMYRYHMLDGARRNAKRTYYEGARYPYQSADTGDEASPVFGFEGRSNPEAFAKKPLYHFVLSNMEVQITASVMFGVYEYYKLTGDSEFMLNCGLEMFIETARFWMSRMEWIEENQRYEILGVIGPDEFHEDVDNNPYTNHMAYLNIERAARLYSQFKQTNLKEVETLEAKINFDENEAKVFEERLSKMYLPQPNEKGILEQFEGYFDLKDYSKGDMNPIDLIKLDFTGKPIPNALGGELKEYGERGKTRIVKQCDVVLLLCMLPDLFDYDIVVKNYDYYEPRTMHASSLSPNTASVMGIRCGRDKYSYSLLDLSASIDQKNVQLNSHHGLHLASIGGTWMNVLYGYGGIYLNKEFDFELRPVLPDAWNSFSYSFILRGSKIKVYFDGKLLKLKLKEGEPVSLKVAGETVTVSDETIIKWEQ